MKDTQGALCLVTAGAALCNFVITLSFIIIHNRKRKQFGVDRAYPNNANGVLAIYDSRIVANDAHREKRAGFVLSLFCQAVCRARQTDLSRL